VFELVSLECLHHFIKVSCLEFSGYGNPGIFQGFNIGLYIAIKLLNGVNPNGLIVVERIDFISGRDHKVNMRRIVFREFRAINFLRGTWMGQ